MTRVVDTQGIVHFRNPHNAKFCICGANAFRGEVDLFGGGSIYPLKETSERVNCPGCARVVCAIRNEPYNTLFGNIETETRERGCFDAVKPDEEVQ